MNRQSILLLKISRISGNFPNQEEQEQEEQLKAVFSTLQVKMIREPFATSDTESSYVILEFKELKKERSLLDLGVSLQIKVSQ